MERSIYLTFDDGPAPGMTEWVLSQLSRYKVRATFFCVGANISKYPELFERIRAEGHVVGNHTMRHPKGFRVSAGEYIKEVDECKKLIGNHLFRPPYGQLRRSQYKALVKKGYRIILWDVISYDFEKIPEEQCAQNVMKHTRNGSIVLFHDNLKAEKNIRYALPVFLEYFTGKGFQFKTFSG
jgi:peptidoglycan/xylan/chitin deacetylase (PgdA/CDA1 family)